VPKKRSNIRKMSPTVTAGKASTIRNCVTSAIQTNTGMRMSVMPGARMPRIVTMKFTAEITDAAPRICRLNIQKSTLSPGEYCSDVRFA
jgi:hypothetical protein